MDFSYTPEDDAFRAELREWLAANLPEFMASGEIGDENNPDRRTMLRRQAWQRCLHGGRWAAINWPKSWGGREATVMQNTIYSEEMARAKTPGIYNANGLWQIGPMILRWGTEEQQQMWLPGILNADVHWCQGFTEPEAGSDLANLRTLAVRDGDEYVVTGRKIWISTAHLAKWGLFLVRTDPTAIERGTKHEGITALIVDMELPGIEVNVIRDITGGELFCEVNFDGARVPVGYRLGEENQGWNVAMGTLASERVGTSGLSVSMRIELDNLIATARQNNPEALDDPGIRDRIARLWTQLELTRLLNARALSKILKGEKNWPEVPLAKLQWSYLSQTIAELGVDILGASGVLAAGAPMRWTRATGATTTYGSATPRSGRGRPRCRRTSSPTAPSRCLAVDGAILGHRQDIAVGVAEPGHPGPTRGHPHSEVVLVHAVEPLKAHAGRDQSAHRRRDVVDGPSEHRVGSGAHLADGRHPQPGAVRIEHAPERALLHGRQPEHPAVEGSGAIDVRRRHECHQIAASQHRPSSVTASVGPGRSGLGSIRRTRPAPGGPRRAIVACYLRKDLLTLSVWTPPSEPSPSPTGARSSDSSVRTSSPRGRSPRTSTSAARRCPSISACSSTPGSSRAGGTRPGSSTGPGPKGSTNCASTSKGSGRPDCAA